MFLIGVWAVLFKTLYVASASNSRLDGRLSGLCGAVKYAASQRPHEMDSPVLRLLSGAGTALYLWRRDPRAMVILGGFVQAATLPIISGAAVYLRYRRTDRRLAPSRLSDVCLWIAFLSISVVAIYAIHNWAVDQL